MREISVNEACIGCKVCVKVCPVNVLAFNANTGRALPQNSNGCIGCGHCIVNCPVNAIAVKGLGLTPLAQQDTATAYDTVRNVVLGRRSTRLFLDKTVPKSYFDELLAAACYAPTARNSLGVHWVVVMDPQKVQRLSALAVEWFSANGMPALALQWEKGYDIINRHAPHLVVTHSNDDTAKPVEDAAIALTTFELLANARGLGTCWAGFFMTAAKDYAPLHELLELPLGHKVRGALMVGYSAVKPQSAPLRLPDKTRFV